MMENKEYWIKRAELKQLLTEKNIKKIERQLKKNYKEAIAKEKEESALSLVDYQFNNEDNKDDPVGEDDGEQ